MERENRRIMRTPLRNLIFTVMFVAMMAWPGAAQENQKPAAGPDQMPTFRKNVNLVGMFFNVKDKHGGFVTGVTAASFELQADGKPQTINCISAETNRHLTLGLMVD